MIVVHKTSQKSDNVRSLRPSFHVLLVGLKKRSSARRSSSAIQLPIKTITAADVQVFPSQKLLPGETVTEDADGGDKHIINNKK
jgi:hypothetical protein